MTPIAITALVIGGAGMALILAGLCLILGYWGNVYATGMVGMVQGIALILLGQALWLFIIVNGVVELVIAKNAPPLTIIYTFYPAS